MSGLKPMKWVYLMLVCRTSFLVESEIQWSNVGAGRVYWNWRYGVDSR